MKTLAVGIASYGDIKARTLAIARGELKPSAGEPRVWFPSAETFARILSNRNRALLGVITERSPQSLTELAGLTGRKKSNLSRTLKTMQRYGLVALDRGAGRSLIPKVPYTAISLYLPISKTAPGKSRAA
jgi:predicted transcriptional regulator